MAHNRGQNPQSKQNLKQGPIAKSKDAKATNLSLSPKAREIIKKVGDNNMSEGVEVLSKIFEEMSQDRLFNQSPIFNQALTIMEALSHDPSKAIELQPRIVEVAEKMQSLQIEEDYKEMIAEGVIKTKSGAYII